MRRPALLVLFGATLALNASFFMLIPIFPVYVTGTLGLSAAAAGFVLAVRQFSQNVPMVLGGAVADRFSHRLTMVAGLVARAVGFIGLGYATDLSTLTLAAIVAALGGCCFDAASRAAVARLVPADERLKAFAILSTVFVIGSTVGPLAGVAALGQGFTFVCLLGAGWLLAAAVTIVLFVPGTADAPQGGASIRQSLVTALADRAFLRFSVLCTGQWLLGSVLYVALPLHVAALTGGPEAVGLLFSMYAGILLVLQYPVASFTARRMTPRARLASGLAASSIGFTLIGLMGGLPGLIACLAIIAVGRMLTDPTFNEMVTHLAPPGSVATYVGLGYLGLGIGGAIGNLTAGVLFDLAAEFKLLWAPWLIYGLVGLILAVLFRRLTFAAPS